MADPVYSAVAAFADRLASLGVTDAVVSPGSRSTPLTLCVDAHPRINTWIQLDERSAGFFALGLGRATGRPAVLVCTSGTAAANYLPAVVEASHAGVPLIVCTADRPPELRGWGSPQTIDQVGLYGTAVRWSIDLPMPDEAGPDVAAGWADAAVAAALGADPGPVHLNWPLREPLEPESPDVATPMTGQMEDARPVAVLEPESTGHLSSPELGDLAEITASCERGVVIAGPWPAGGLDQELRWSATARRFAAWARWPLIGEPIAHARCDPSGESGPPEACVVATADHLLADEALGNELRPDAVVLVGRTATTKAVRLWLERTSPRHVVLIDPEERWERAVFRLTGHVPSSVEALDSLTATPRPSLTDPDRIADVARGQRSDAATARPSLVDPGELAAADRGLQWDAATAQRADRAAAGGWLDTWAQLDSAARRAVAAAVDGGPMLSARVARVLVDALPDNAVLVAANSLPVRDLDAFVFDTGSVVCCANRGAAGIDGTVSTALGIAAADPSRTVSLYIGDLALLHDLGGLAAAARLGLHLTVVCVDNDGGGIFSLLPVAERIPTNDFERLFRTPHGLDLCGLDGFAGIRARPVVTAEELQEAVSNATAGHKPGVDLIVVQVPRDEDVAQRRAVTAAAQQAARQVESATGAL